jgi:hypothetical protein
MRHGPWQRSFLLPRCVSVQHAIPNSNDHYRFSLKNNRLAMLMHLVTSHESLGNLFGIEDPCSPERGGRCTGRSRGRSCGRRTRRTRGRRGRAAGGGAAVEQRGAAVAGMNLDR